MITIRVREFIVLVALTAIICGCGHREKLTTESEEAAVYEATTGSDGVAELDLSNQGGTFVAVALDPTGAPLPNLHVSYFAATPEPIVAFTSEDGSPVATFAVTLSGSSSGRSTSALSEDEGSEIGVFILSMLDLGAGHLYDPLRDGFTTPHLNKLRTIRYMLNYEDLRALLDTVPGLTERSTKTVGAMRADMVDTAGYMFRRLNQGDMSQRAQLFAHRFLRIATWMSGVSPNYRVIMWRGEETETAEPPFFLIPLGVQSTVTIDGPLAGQTFSGATQRDVTVAGRINEEPALLTTDGGHVELFVGGAEIPGVVVVGGDGSGASTFSLSGLLRLEPGENQIEIVAYIGESGRGLETPINGESGRAAVRVTYEDASNPAPVLSNLQYTATVPGPNGSIPLSWHFRDADGDIARFHEVASGTMNGQPVHSENEGAIAQIPALSCMVATVEGDCGHAFNYRGVENASLSYEFWVIDGTGLASNKLLARLTIASGVTTIVALPSGAPEPSQPKLRLILD